MSEDYETPEKHRYLIHVLWTIADEEHGHGHALHRVYEGEAEGDWDPKGYIEKFVQSNFPQWMPDGNGLIGNLNPRTTVHEINVFRVAEKDSTAWTEWSEAAMATRDEVNQKRSYEADMTTIKLLQQKWGLLDEQEQQEPQEG